LSLETENNVSQILLRTDGSVKLSSSAISMDSSSAALVSTSLSLSSTTDSSSATAGGTLTVAGGGAFAGTLFIKRQLSLANTTLTDTGSTSGFLLANTSAKFSLAGNTTNSAKASALTLYSLYDSSTVGNYSGITVGTDSSTSSIVTVANTPTKVTSLVLSTGSPSQIYLATNGNVGISTSSPNSLLSVAGSFTAQNSSLYTLNVSTGSVLRGAVTVGSDLIVTGTSTLNDQVNLYQLYVSGTTNASSTTGSVVVAGGATLGKGLYVSQDITFKGALIGASAQTATLGNLQVSNNSIIGGNLQITGTSTATNLTSASLVLSGGASILKDLRLGGQQYNSGVTLFSASGDLIQFLDPTETKRFSIYRDPSSLNLSFSRYDSLGVPVDKPFEISSATGTVFFNNNSSSAGGSSASLVAYGGLSILNTTDASGATAGGGLSILGGASIAKKLFVGGNVIFSSSTSSDLPTNGAVTVIGGLGVSGNFNLQGNAVINGNLTISGSTTSVASNNVVLSDNILVLNSGPSGSKDSGYLIQRYQFDNDTAQGDVVADLPSFSTVLPGQSGANLSQVILPVTTSSINNYYLGWWIEITSGFSNGQVRKIIGFVGSTRTVTLSSQWTNQNPSIGDSFALYNKPYVGSIYSEIRDRFEFGSTIADPGSGVGNVNLTDTLGVYMKNLVIASTTTSNTATSGSILTPGGLGISCTEDATSATSGNGLTVAGGASIAKTLYVGSQLYVNGVNITPSTGQVSSQTFNGSNGATNQDVTGAFFDSTVWSFDLYLAVRLHATTNLYSNYHVRGVSRETSWEISTDYTGDSVVSFSITSAGQLQYTSPTFAGFTDLTFKFRAQTN
jgi:cytoskeletal protein CcmA (bactofilin family)